MKSRLLDAFRRPGPPESRGREIRGRNRGVSITRTQPRASRPPSGGAGFAAARQASRLLGLTLALLGASIGRAGSSDRPAPPDPAPFIFRTTLRAAAPAIRPSLVLPGFSRVEIEGFGSLQRPGEAALPVRVERIALPEAGDPVLRILGFRDRGLGALRVEPAPGPGDTRSGPEEERVPGAAPHREKSFRPKSIPAGNGPDRPAPPVRLGEVGYLRDQRYVDLVFTPVRVNPPTSNLLWTPEVEIEIRTLPATAAAAAREGCRDPRFEAVYEGSFLNGEQARARRVSARDQASPRLTSFAGAALENGGAGTVYRIELKDEGVYRISCASLPGCAVADLIGLDPAGFRLRNRGLEVPIQLLDGGDASFDLGDILEFYGQPRPEPFTVQVCAQPTCPGPVYESYDQSDINVYLLDAPGPGGRLRMAAVSGTPGGLAAEAEFTDTAHAEVNDRFSPLADADPYYWAPQINAGGGSTCGVIGARCKDIPVPLPGLSAAPVPASVKVRMRGISSLFATSPDHRTQLLVNGSPFPPVDWDGEVLIDLTAAPSQTTLTDPTTLRLDEQVLAGVNPDQAIVDFAEITYRRLFQAQSDRLFFDFPNQAAKFAPGGFSAAPVTAYDVSRPLPGSADLREARVVTGGSAGAGSLTFEVASEGAPTGATRRFLVVGPGGYRSPLAVSALPANNLLDPANEADYLVVAHRSLIDTAPGSPWQQFAAYLQSARGLQVRLVYIDEIYDAFNDSLEHVEAIRTFLAYAHGQWVGPSGTAAPPAYLLLVGDAVWDTKNNLNQADWIDLVPTPILINEQALLKYYSSDTYLATFLGTDMSPDILHGRLPVRTLAEANDVFAKLLAYAQSPPAGNWRADSFFITDVGNDVVETSLFEGVQDTAANYFNAPWTRFKQYYAQPPYNAPPGGNGPVAQFKADFVSHWNSAHAAVASYTGHGSFDILGNDLFFRPADVSLLTNGAFQPFFYNSDCLSGGFHAVGVDSMAEAFLRSTTGGAIGYFAPSGLSFTFFGNVVSGSLFGDLFAPQRFREIGTLTARAQGALYNQGAIIDMQGYTLVGDPATRLVLPAPAPPGGFASTAGNGVVDLAWTASADPAAVGTNIYRATSPAGPYAKVNGAPVAGTTFADSTVANGTTYFYRAVSIDAGGFEGAVTNTNADCGATPATDGPSCRRAVPRNLVPPIAPQGVLVRDTGSGTSLEVSWLANPESDIQKYEVSYGTTPGSHPTVKNAGTATTFLVTGLTAGTPYYLVVTATNTSAIAGPASGEVSATPHVFFGLAAPRTIQDLAIAPAGDDLVLTWGAVTTDIYGNAAAVDHYNIYRGSTPTFIPSDSLNRIGQVPATGNPSFTHVGGRVAPGDAYYLVSALDQLGTASGLGGDLPAGILGLTVAPSPTPGMLRISWNPVSTNVFGQPTAVSHYRLHGSQTPVPRNLIGPSNLLQDNLVATSVDVPDPASARYYYNVLVVDVRGNLSPY